MFVERRSDMKKFLSMLLAAVMVLCFMTACGEKKSGSDSSKTAGDTGTVSEYAEYDGYTYFLDNGDVKYRLDIKTEFKMHCFFQEGSSEYTEEIYTMDLDSAVKDGYSLTIRKITDSSGNDISDSFESLVYTFVQDEINMTVKRDESKLAGGESSTLTSGTYVFVSSSGKSSDAVDTSASQSSSKTYTGKELGKLAQDYYRSQNGYCPPEVDVTFNDNGTFTIQLYENVKNDSGSGHTATSAWYTVDRYGNGKNDITEEKVQFGK